MNIQTLLPSASLANEPLLARLRDELGATREGRGFFPTVRVREVCYRIRAESDASDTTPALLYETASLVMLDLLLTRQDLRMSWRPLEMIRVVAALAEETPRPQRLLLLLFLMVGLSPAEIAEVTGAAMVSEPLERLRFQLHDRLTEAGFSMERLHAGGIGPVGEVTRVLEKVRAGEMKLAEALAADYQELLRIAENKLGVRRTPGYDSPSDVINAATFCLPVNPEQAPQNRRELRALVSRIVYHVVIDHNVRVPISRGGAAQHEEVDASIAAADDGDAEDAVIRAQMLEAVSGALDRIRREEGTAIVPATRSLQDKLFYALMNLRIEQPRAFEVLLLKIEGGRPNAQISKQIGLSVAGVKRDFNAAIDFLRDALGVPQDAAAR